MSIAAYLGKNTRELRMPRSDGRPDELGIRFQGRALSGELTVQMAQRLRDMGICRAQSLEARRAYDDLDPVLKAHTS